MQAGTRLRIQCFESNPLRQPVSGFLFLGDVLLEKSIEYGKCKGRASCFNPRPALSRGATAAAESIDEHPWVSAPPSLLPREGPQPRRYRGAPDRAGLLREGVVVVV